MELKEFQGLALRTESKIDGIKLNRGNLISLLRIVVASTEILDGIKKAAFYNKTTKLEENLGKQIDDIRQLVNTLHLTNTLKGPIDTIINPDENIPNVDPRVFHGIIGIITESGELASALLKSLEDPYHTVDAVNIQEEMSDIAWYEAILHDTLKLDWGQGLENVINKLRIRYPDKYSDEAAANRDLDAERAALEVGVPHTVSEDDVRYFREKLLRAEARGENTDKVAEQLRLIEDSIVIYHERRLPQVEVEIMTAAGWPLNDIKDLEPAEATQIADFISGKFDPTSGITSGLTPLTPGVVYENTQENRRCFWIDLPDGMSSEEAKEALIEAFERKKFPNAERDE